MDAVLAWAEAVAECERLRDYRDHLDAQRVSARIAAGAEHPDRAPLVTGWQAPGRDELRFLLREHAKVIQPGEVLIVQVPPDWPPQHVRDLQDALRAYCEDVLGFNVVVVPGTAMTVGRPLTAVPGGAG